MKKSTAYIFYLILPFLFTGCTLVKMGQESAEAVKVASTHGYQNGKEPEKIRNLKDFLVDENEIVILAENAKKTVFRLRDFELGGRLDMISDPADYCESKGGKVIFGKQVASFIYTEFDSIDFEFSSVKSNFKKKRKRGYSGWMKCQGTQDDFEILRKGRSRYFVVEHEKEQLQGYALRWIMDYMALDEVDPATLHVGGWDYVSMVKVAGLCLLSEGKVFIVNRYTKDKKMGLNDYFIQQLNPRDKIKPYLLASGEFICEQSKEKRADAIFDITFAKKYRSLIYTKR